MIGKKRFEKNTNHFLERYESAKNWACENVNDLPEALCRDDKEYGDAEMYKIDQIEERIWEYSDMYDTVTNQGETTVYRAICAPTSDIDFDHLGKYWSFKRDGVGCYGSGDRSVGVGPETVLKGRTKSRYIDWEYGFTSFLWYGKQQWECALKEESPVLVTGINGRSLRDPIEGTV